MLSQYLCCQHIFLPVHLPPALGRGFYPKRLHFPVAKRCFSPWEMGHGSKISSRCGRGSVFPAPRWGRAWLPLISRLLPAGHRPIDLPMLAGWEGVGTHGSLPPPPPPVLKVGLCSSARSPTCWGGTAASPRYDGMGMTWRGAKHPWVLLAHP